MQKTTILKKNEATNSKKWYSIDASNMILGDLAVKAANILRGKNKKNFTPNVDCGDYLIITNVEKIKLTGNKRVDKMYYNVSGYMSGLRTRSAAEMINKYPEEMIEIAIKGMLPKNKLGNAILKKAFIYKGIGKDHSAQSPIPINYGK
jgi:large subunit ribosomal protein L13